MEEKEKGGDPLPCCRSKVRQEGAAEPMNCSSHSEDRFSEHHQAHLAGLGWSCEGGPYLLTFPFSGRSLLHQLAEPQEG